MLKFIGPVIWLIATVLFITSVTVSYNNNAERIRKSKFVCYTFVYDANGKNIVNNVDDKLTGADLQKLVVGSKVLDYTISTANLSDTSYDASFDTVDNPTITNSKMSCFIKK